MTKKDALNGKPYAGNPHIRFDEDEVVLVTPRRGSLLYSRKMIKAASAVLLIAAVALWSNEAVSADFDVDLRTARIEASTPLNESVRIAVEELEKHLSLIASSRSVDAVSGSVFIIGKPAPGSEQVKAHESHVRAVDGRIYFWGDDSSAKGRQRWGSLFAVYCFLEKHLGVKWVEPGDRGIVIKKRDSVTIPDGLICRFVPPFDMAILRTYGGSPGSWLKRNKDVPKALRIDEARAKQLGTDRVRWNLRMRIESRKRFNYGHAFIDWNERFAETRPEFLALDKKGRRGYPGETAKKSRKAKYIKLCVSNPAVADQVIEDWCKGGTNEYLNVCPNDAHGYCLCDNCREWDADLPGEDFNVHKTDRYVRFWNRIAELSTAIRPDVKLIVYLYAAYRHPPRKVNILYPDNMLAGIVPITTEDSLAMIDTWRDKGLKHYFVRPNYLCSSIATMRGLERYFCEEFKANVKRGMIGADEDNAPRATTQFETYVIARLMSDPELSFETIEEEYLSQYGSAAPEMKEVFARTRMRGEKGRDDTIERNKRKRDADASAVVDESNLYSTGYASHTEADYDGDLEIIGRALAKSDLTELERWRVNRVRAIVENAKLTRRFILSRDSMELSKFAELGKELILKRIELKDAIDENWGRVFRAFPAEVRWWMPIRGQFLKKFWGTDFDFK